MALVTLTENATSKVKTLLSDKEEGTALRLFIKSGGCSGFSYGMALDRPKEQDTIIEHNGITVLVDAESVQHINGAEVDYVDSMMGAGFKINNPNAVSTCGCGSSFRTADSKGQASSCSH